MRSKDERWGIANSLHVISMAHYLIGLPEQMRRYRFGKPDWYPSGDRFVGAGALLYWHRGHSLAMGLEYCQRHDIL